MLWAELPFKQSFRQVMSAPSRFGFAVPGTEPRSEILQSLRRQFFYELLAPFELHLSAIFHNRFSCLAVRRLTAQS